LQPLAALHKNKAGTDQSRATAAVKVKDVFSSAYLRIWCNSWYQMQRRAKTFSSWQKDLGLQNISTAPEAQSLDEVLPHKSGNDVVLERDLIRSSLGFELFLLTLRDHPVQALQWLFKGKAALLDLPVEPASLLYNEGAVEQLRSRRQLGDAVEIASDLPEAWSARVLSYLGLAGSNAAEQRPPVTKNAGGILAYLKVLRVHQWTKNLLIFVPLFMSHQFLFAEPLTNTVLAFLAFSLVASSIYVLNDMMDLRQDRRHPVKCRRAFASGALPVWHGLVLLPLLLCTAGLITMNLPPMFGLALAAYITLNLGYTFYLKRKLLVDVMALSGAYTLRILAGNAAGPVEVSNWLLAFTMFLFLSLALVKRYVELDTVADEAGDAKRVMGRGYRKSDLDMIAQLGVASGFSAVVVLALYVEGAGKSGLYSHREIIWLVVPVVLYIIGRIWVLAKRRELPDDPVMFIIRDWRSHLMAGLIGLIFVFAV
jgi:4-hydroxybenzoate polyprenyltransferase